MLAARASPVNRHYPTDPNERRQLERRIAQLYGQIKRLIFHISFPEAAEFARKQWEEQSKADMSAAIVRLSAPDTSVEGDNGGD